MRMYRRIGVAAAAGVAALALAGCGGGGPVGAGSGAGGGLGAAAFDVSAEGEALAALGLPAADLAAAGYQATDPSPSAEAGKAHGRPGWRKPRLNRALLRKNALHGEVVVQTKDGTKTVVVQRGQVTAIDDTTMTVKSTDGFTQTWRFGDPIRVVEHRNTVQPEDIEVGTQVGVAGAKDDGTSTARLIVVPTR